MDLSNLESFNFSLQVAGPLARNVGVGAKTSPGVDLAALWTSLRAEVLGLKTLGGFALDVDGEDLNLARSQRTVTATLRLKSVAPPAAVAPAPLPTPSPPPGP